MKQYLFLLPLFGGLTQAKIADLEQYKEFLRKGTYEGECDKSLQSRYETFKYAFEHFEKHNGRIVVELGTTRSFVHGGLPGCNSDDIRFWTPNEPKNWDWGAGGFTRMAATCLSHLNPVIHTVDLAPAHIRRCKIITQDYASIMRYHVTSSEQFLHTWDASQKIDLLYLDTGDMTPIEPTAQLQLREAKIIVERDLLSDTGLLVIDDVRNPTPQKFGETSKLGKAKYSMAYLLEHGFEIVVDEYQVIMQKKRNH
jgi:hypothetical protein